VNRVHLLPLAGLLLVVALAEFPGAAWPAYPGSNGKIAFASERDGGFELYVMNAVGSGQTRLTNNSADDREPAWSPDGREIAFVSNFEIYVMNADGTEQPTQLTHNSDRGDEWPTWSPDGSKIAFTRYGDPFGAVYVVSKDGSPPNALTNNAANDFDPAWSPDGSAIAFVSDRNGFLDVYVMNTDGSAQSPLTNAPANDSDPAWSPDGSKIAFTSLRDGNAEIYVMSGDGTGETRITNDPATDAFPAWSPDGEKIVFTRGSGFGRELYVMNADGSGQTRLTSNFDRDDYADWQALPASPPPGGPCIVLSRTSVAISGTASTPSTRRRAESEHLTVTNCGDSAVHLNARATDATGSAGTWQLTTDSGGGSVCGVGVNVFRADVSLWLTGGQATTPLSTSNAPLVGTDGATPFTLAAAADQELSAGVDLPCVGSVGLGDPMTTNVTLTAIAP
jgi:Tol biopolymer transport system component